MVHTSNNIISKIALSLLVILFCGATVQAQYDEGRKKNSIYVNYGNVIFVSQASIAYERLILDKDDYVTKGRLMYGNYLTNNLDFEAGARRYESYLGLSVVQLLYWVEINAGVAYGRYTFAPGIDPVEMIDSTTIQESAVAFGSVGVRYEKNNFLFRAGVGNLELLYIGLGMNF